jgi:hypothetical protein
MNEEVTKTFKQINVKTRYPGGFVDVLFSEDVNDPMPFIVTVSPEYVAHKTNKHLPTNTAKILDYVRKYGMEIRDLALRTKVAGKNTLVL